MGLGVLYAAGALLQLSSLLTHKSRAAHQLCWYLEVLISVHKPPLAPPAFDISVGLLFCIQSKSNSI